MKDFCVDQGGSPGTLALIGEVLGAAGVNIEGLCLVTYEGRGIIHFLVEDAERLKFRILIPKMTAFIAAI